ncbi:MAG: hypothetical protein ACTSQP_10305 [Promethearchaeota archaeon]
MNEKEEKNEDNTDYDSKFENIWKKLVLDDDNKGGSKIKEDKPKIGIEKVELEDDDAQLENMIIEFSENDTIEEITDKKEEIDKIDEEEDELHKFASKILDMVDLKQKIALEDEEIISKSEIKKKEISKLKNKKTEYVVSPEHTPVLLFWKAYKRMVGYATRYANNKIEPKKWREVYGILVGSVEGNSRVLVKDAIPMVVGDRAGVQYENKQYVDMAQIDESIYERSIQNKKDDFIIGWWHTHPGFGSGFYSEIDCYTQLGYQSPNPFAVGLVFDHTEKKMGFLGVSAIRLTDVDEGILSDYHLVDILYEEEKEIFEEKSNKIIEKVLKGMPAVLKELDYIENTLRKKYLAQLQRNFGLILVPKRDIKVVEDEEEAEEDERYLYVWDPEFFKKSYRIPKFREKIEETIKKYEKELIELKKKNQIKKFEEKRKKYSERIKAMLEKPQEWVNKLLQEFNSSIEKIFPFYDYLDTDERKIIEYFEERISTYQSILDNLIKKSEFNITENK